MTARRSTLKNHAGSATCSASSPARSSIRGNTFCSRHTKFNGIDDPDRLNPGDELKVVRGPFSALVDLDKRQLTLIVEDCYAGRFNLVAVGDMARNVEGTFEVAEKLPNGPPTSAPGNPIHHWVRLGNNGNMWIVGTSDITSVHPSGLNLNSRDAEDVFDILSTGSRVVVRR